MIGKEFLTRDSKKAYRVIDGHHMFGGVWKCYPADKEPPYKPNLIESFSTEFIEQSLKSEQTKKP
jgi:hypothetical protein